MDATLKRYLPSLEIPPSEASDPDAVDISHKLFPNESYTDGDKVEIRQWAASSTHLSDPDVDEAKRTERLGSLNSHLATRTLLLGSKPSAADVLVYAGLAPSVKQWSPEERTGERGYHHIIRYVDFVEKAPLFGLKVKDADKVRIDPSHIVSIPPRPDPKAEKERKKKANAEAEAAGGHSVVADRTKDSEAPKAAAKEGAAADGAAGPAKKAKKEKAPKQPKPAPAAAKEMPLTPALIDLRVGHILKAEAHPNADSLYVSTIAVGDPPGAEHTSEHEGQVVRTVCSGLNGLVPLADMQGRKVVAVCNLKPVTMRGVKSVAMVLAASPRPAPSGEPEGGGGGGGHAKETVELVDPPAGAAAGARVAFEGWKGEPECQLNPKKKVWESCQAGFTTTEDLAVAFERARVEQLQKEEARPQLAKLVVKDVGPCTVKSLKGAVVR